MCFIDSVKRIVWQIEAVLDVFGYGSLLGTCCSDEGDGLYFSFFVLFCFFFSQSLYWTVQFYFSCVCRPTFSDSMYLWTCLFLHVVFDNTSWLFICTLLGFSICSLLHTLFFFLKNVFLNKVWCNSCVNAISLVACYTFTCACIRKGKFIIGVLCNYDTCNTVSIACLG